jgi:hypothetical protein
MSIKLTRTNARLGLIKRITRDYYELETSGGKLCINNSKTSLGRENLIKAVYNVQGKKILN